MTQPIKYSIALPSACGAHQVKLDENNNVVVDWYDLGEDVPYESANTLVFYPSAQSKLWAALGLHGSATPRALVNALSGRFSSYWEIKAFADHVDAPYEKTVDFSP